ncbi:MAG TPA: oligosaccharide flippase family protein [Terriglobia bacterium]|nr:oligosaccharide flippase family protein [Terriglobia bacterium]
MLKGSRIGLSVFLNWIALAISVVVAFFLSPFVVHHLGNVAYGVWTLVISMTAYMGLLDLGLRGAVTRFVAKHHARGEHEESSRAFSAALWFRAWIGLLIVLTSLGLSRAATHIFHIPPEMQVATSWAITIAGTSFAVTLTVGVFSGVLAALNRFDLISAVTIGQTGLRALGIVWLLKSGYGIAELAAWELIVVVLANASLIILSLRAYPQLQVLFSRPDSAMLWQLWGYSIYVLLINICAQMVYYTDNIVVGVLISAGAVTFFTIAGSLLEYARQIVAALGTVLLPLASSLDARGQDTELRSLLIQGTRATLLISLPIQVALFFHGHTFIALWMGEDYANVSARLIQILLVAHVFAIANYTSYNIVFGLAKHKPVALISTVEAAANLLLSIFLVRKIGLEGVAWGTAIPSLGIQLLFWPRYICKTLEMPVRQYVWQAWIRSGLAVVPFGIACYFSNNAWAPRSLLQFFTQMSLLFPVLVLGVVLSFSKEIAVQLRSQPNWFVRRWDAALQFVRKAS